MSRKGQNFLGKIPNWVIGLIVILIVTLIFTGTMKALGVNAVDKYFLVVGELHGSNIQNPGGSGTSQECPANLLDGLGQAFKAAQDAGSTSGMQQVTGGAVITPPQNTGGSSVTLSGGRCLIPYAVPADFGNYRLWVSGTSDGTTIGLASGKASPSAPQCFVDPATGNAAIPGSPQNSGVFKNVYPCVIGTLDNSQSYSTFMSDWQSGAVVGALATSGEIMPTSFQLFGKYQFQPNDGKTYTLEHDTLATGANFGFLYKTIVDGKTYLCIFQNENSEKQIAATVPLCGSDLPPNPTLAGFGQSAVVNAFSQCAAQQTVAGSRCYCGPIDVSAYPAPLTLSFSSNGAHSSVTLSDTLPKTTPVTLPLTTPLCTYDLDTGAIRYPGSYTMLKSYATSLPDSDVYDAIYTVQSSAVLKPAIADVGGAVCIITHKPGELVFDLPGKLGGQLGSLDRCAASLGTSSASSSASSPTSAPLAGGPEGSSHGQTPSSGVAQNAELSSHCTPEKYCSGNDLHQISSACTDSVVQFCKYGCVGTSCQQAPPPSSIPTPSPSMQPQSSASFTPQVGYPTDTHCTAGWPAHQGPTITINEKNHVCDLFEVHNSKILSYVQAAATCFQTNCGASSCDKFFCPLAFAQAGANGADYSQNQVIFKRFMGFYLTYSLGPAAKYMQGYFVNEINCGDGTGTCSQLSPLPPPVAPFCGDGVCGPNETALSCPSDCGSPRNDTNSTNETRNNTFNVTGVLPAGFNETGNGTANVTAARGMPVGFSFNSGQPNTVANELVCKGPVGKPDGWASDTDISKDSCIFSDLPAHVDLSILRTGTCVDYSIALTTLLRYAGFSANEVYSVQAPGHEYNLVKFPGYTKWMTVDTVGNSASFGGPSWSWDDGKKTLDHCDYYAGTCVNDNGPVACPPRSEVYGCG